MVNVYLETFRFFVTLFPTNFSQQNLNTAENGRSAEKIWEIKKLKNYWIIELKVEGLPGSSKWATYGKLFFVDLF